MADDFSPSDVDLVARTALAEGGADGPEGIAAVANVIHNRLESGEFGSSIPSVIYQPNAFEAWSLNRRDPNYPGGFSARDPNYQQAYQIAQSVLQGKGNDPTGNALYYYNPSLQSARGRPTPSFAQGQPSATIGRQVFYGGNDDLLGSWGAAPKQSYTPVSSGGGVTVSVPSGEGGEDLLGAWTPQTKQTQQQQQQTPPPVDHNAPIPQYIAQELAAHQGDTLEDRALRFGLGVIRGGGDVADTLAMGITGAGRQGANLLANYGVISPQTAGTVGQWANSVQGDIAKDYSAWNAAAANSPLAETGRIGGQILGTGPLIEAAPLSVAGAPLTRALVAGAGAGAEASALTSAASNEPFTNQVAQGALVGGALGPAGYGASALGSGLRRLLFGSIDPNTARLAQAAGNYGIQLGPGELSPTEMVRRASSLLQRFPLSGYGERAADNQNALNTAIAQSFGENSNKVTTDTINNAKTRIGNMFDSVAARTGNIAADPTFQQDMMHIGTDARSVLGDSEFNTLTNLVKDISSTIDPNTNSVSAKSYQALTRKNAPLDRLMQDKNPNLRFYAGQIRDALDDAMQRSAPPDVVQDLLDARSQWKAMKTVEPLAKKSPTGDISPALLLGAVNKSYSGSGGTLGELGRIGQRFLKPQGTSGTAEHLALMRFGPAIAGAIGLGGAYEFDPEHFQRDAALTGLLLGGGRAASAVLRSNRLAQGMIRNALNAPSATQPVANLLARAAPFAALTYRQASPGQ